MGSGGGNRNRLFSELLKVENDENVEGNFDDARETPGSAIPVNQKSSKNINSFILSQPYLCL